MQTEISNFWKTIERSQNPLICFREDMNDSGCPQHGDAIAAALALKSVLGRFGKNTEIASSGFAASPKLQFLGAPEAINRAPSAARRFVISLDVSKNQIGDFSYDLAGGKINIYLTPKQGLFSDTVVQTRHENFKFDLIIALDSPSLPSLGALYHDQAELFAHLPIINIDHNPANEFFGHINIVNVAATSTSEVLAQILKERDTQIDADLATKLLAGMIAKTKSFKTSNLSPRSLQLASRLLELGARRDEIINNFYRTRSVATLKLWGRALARLKSLPELKLVWTLLAREDFMHAGATTDAELVDVIDELLVFCPEANTVALLYEQGEKSICAVVATAPGIDARELGKPFGSTGSRSLVKFCLTGLNIVAAEKEVVEKVKQQLGNLARN